MILAAMEEEQRLHTELTETGEIFKGYAPRLADLNRRQALQLPLLAHRELHYPWHLLHCERGRWHSAGSLFRSARAFS